tara:strand:- start:485 stop:892 length:408 start_codon:yes stop_codon:yes gene_type:complete
MENNEESEAPRGHIVNMVRDLINNDRPSFGNIFTHLAINLIERSMIREAENRSLEENNKPVVATEEQMESLGNYQRVNKEEVSEDNTCCICLAPYKTGEGKRTLGCEHSFHKKCIDKWLTVSKKECPICRKNPFD